MDRYRAFYDERRKDTYAHDYDKFKAEEHPSFSELKAFIDRFHLKNKRCLEIGSSGGFFQDMVDDYSGTDISEGLGKYYHKTYKVGEDGAYPFGDEDFDCIWTITVYEHIPKLQKALWEIKRMLKPGGLVFFAPAWHCRPWASGGYNIRSYRDLNLRGKIVKASIPIRNNLLWRSIFIFGYKFTNIRYKKIKPNYEKYWGADSDACNQMYSHDAILWFLCNGFSCLSHETNRSILFVRSTSLIFQKKSKFKMTE